MKFRAVVMVVSLVAACGTDGDGVGDAGPTVIFSAPAAPSAFVAYRDGDGAWLVSIPDATGVHTLTVASSRYSVIMACGVEGAQGASIYQLTTDEPMLVDPRPCDASFVDLTGTYLPASPDQAAFDWGGARGGGANGDYTVRGAPGRHDLVGLLGQFASKIIILRDVMGGQQPVDFALGFDLVRMTPTHNDAAIYGTRIVLAGRTTSISATGLDTFIFQAPETALGPSDLNLVSAGESDGTTLRARLRAGRQLDDNFDLSQLPRLGMTAPPSVLASSPSTRLHWNRPEVAADVYAFTASGTSTWTLHATAAYAAIASDFEMPDLAGLPGWDDTSLGLHSIPFTSWSASGYTGVTLDQLVAPTQPFDAIRVGSAGRM
ncbi:MAG: hypothetical protein NT062_04500 [Proteobacteria bacterium]|nr:hypothetical protein [Pseudomonadota bacterium]